MTRRRDPSTDLARRVSRAARREAAARTLILDVDGTLAPIAPTPEAARVPPETLHALRALVVLGWTVALVSGRPAAQVRRLAPLGGVRVFGSHGLEGSWDRRPHATLDPRVRRRLARLAREGEALTSGWEGARMERKPAGIAFHDRNVPANRLGQWRGKLREWLLSRDLSGLETLPGRRVLEIRPEGVHKGAVVRRYLQIRRVGKRDDSLVAVGDDRTDEDLFREIRGRGLSIKVGRPGRRTLAEARLPSPSAVRRFLEALAELDARA